MITKAIAQHIIFNLKNILNSKYQLTDKSIGFDLPVWGCSIRSNPNINILLTIDKSQFTDISCVIEIDSVIFGIYCQEDKEVTYGNIYCFSEKWANSNVFLQASLLMALEDASNKLFTAENIEVNPILTNCLKSLIEDIDSEKI
jgi:hypothetical protein